MSRDGTGAPGIRQSKAKKTRQKADDHYDVIGKECPYYFVKHPDAWEGLLNSLTYASVF